MKDLKGIKNIIFDFGNVIMDIDFQLTVKKFKELGFSNIESFLKNYRSLGFFSDYQEGKISDSEFLQKIRENSGVNMSDEAIKTAWNAMLLEYSTDRLIALKDLKLKYKIFLLSNTNNIHYHNFAFRVPMDANIDNYFHKAYYSHILGMSKPGIEIYQHVLKEQALQPHETLFIDDLQENIDGAEAIGMITHLATYPGEWLEWFE